MQAHKGAIHYASFTVLQHFSMAFLLPQLGADAHSVLLSPPSVVCCEVSGTTSHINRAMHACAPLQQWWHAAGITGISQSSQLTSLNLALCREITDTGVASVAALPLLHTLDLTFCDRITDASVHHLHQCVAGFPSPSPLPLPTLLLPTSAPASVAHAFVQDTRRLPGPLLHK